MVSDRDFALLQEEVKCLRKKFSTTVSTSGGYTETLTSPGSSVYPNSFYENCDCADLDLVTPDPVDVCGTSDGDDDVPVGDFGGPTKDTNIYSGVFVFDGIDGVFYKPSGENNYENRNIGLVDTTLQHGCVDVWWYKKVTPNPKNTILWQCGEARVLVSDNAGRNYWRVRTPNAPDGYSLSDITFTQIVSDMFTQNVFFMVAKDKTAHTWLLKTVDNGQNWTWYNLTGYNGVSERVPIWMAQSGGNGGVIWLTTWADGNLTALKLNNDPSITVSSEYIFNSASLWEVENKFETLSPAMAIDTTTMWFYGRTSNPQSLGLSHIIKTEDGGINWSAVEQSYADDWVGALKISMQDGSGNRNITGVRNAR